MPIAHTLFDEKRDMIKKSIPFMLFKKMLPPAFARPQMVK